MLSIWVEMCSAPKQAKIICAKLQFSGERKVVVEKHRIFIYCIFVAYIFVLMQLFLVLIQLKQINVFIFGYFR
jgi:predicted transcriptional regulator